MTQMTLSNRQTLPDDMRLLLTQYPRDAWPDHPNFAASIQNWMDKSRAPDDFAGRLSVYGNLLVRNLHGHHSWEDRSFFPELSAADARFDHGLDMLEADHGVLDEVLDRFTRVGNRVTKLLQLDEVQARDEAGLLLDIAVEIESYLSRHLTDEEDLVVPILLHHKLRG